MKKLTRVFLAVILVLCFVGCSKNSTNPLASEVYQKTIDEMAKAGVGEVTVEADINMVIEGESQNIKMDMIIRSENPNETDINKTRIMTTIKTTVMGLVVDVEYCIYDGNMYMSVFGKKLYGGIKQMGELFGQSLEPVTGIQKPLGNEMDFIKGAKFSELSDGSYQYIIKITDRKVISEILSQTTISNTLVGEMDMKIEQFIMTMVVNKDYHIESQNIDMKVKIIDVGQEVTADYILKITFNNIGQPTVVDFPDFSEYEHYSIMSTIN